MLIEISTAPELARIPIPITSKAIAKVVKFLFIALKIGSNEDGAAAVSLFIFLEGSATVGKGSRRQPRGSRVENGE